MPVWSDDTTHNCIPSFKPTYVLVSGFVFFFSLSLCIQKSEGFFLRKKEGYGFKYVEGKKSASYDVDDNDDDDKV